MVSRNNLANCEGRSVMGPSAPVRLTAGATDTPSATWSPTAGHTRKPLELAVGFDRLVTMMKNANYISEEHPVQIPAIDYRGIPAASPLQFDFTDALPQSMIWCG